MPCIRAWRAWAVAQDPGRWGLASWRVGWLGWPRVSKVVLFWDVLCAMQRGGVSWGELS